MVASCARDKLVTSNQFFQKSHFVQTKDLVGQLKQPVNYWVLHIYDVQPGISSS